MNGVTAHRLGQWEGTLVVARREIGDQLRDWRILTPILVLTLFFPILMNFTARQAVEFVSRYGANIIADRLIPFLLMVVGFFPISISLVIALESFAGERERLSLEPLLATPLTDTQLYVGKFLASLVAPLLAAYVGIFVYLAGLAFRIGWVPPAPLLIQVLLLTTAQALVMVSAAVVISSQTTSVRAANLLASFIIVPVSQLILGESLIMFWGRYSVLWWIVLGLLLLAAVLGRMGLHLFNREELLGREIDLLDLRWALRTFWGAFKGDARSLASWLAGVYRVSLPKLRASVAMMCLALVAAYFIGLNLAGQFTLPGDLLDLSRLEGAVARESFQRLGMYSQVGWLWILSNNVRALAIASFLGAFSFGVLAVILLMAPIILVGYIAGNLALAGQNVGLALTALVLPHATLELPAAVFAGASILNLGLALLSPPESASLGESWLTALAEWARVALGVVLPLLVLAAALESFVTPQIAVYLLTGR